MSNDPKVSEAELAMLPGPIASNEKPEGCSCDQSYHHKLNVSCDYNIDRVLAMRG